MFPFQDFPNHLTRATVLADLLLHHGATFGPMFEFRFMPVPYILGDLMLAGLVEIFGPTTAGALWNTVVLLSWPAALLFLTHVSGVSRNARLLVLFVSLYLATDWFFLLAFTHFRLGMALLVVALGVAHLLRLRFTTARFAWFCVLLLAGYFTHLAFVIFLAPALIVSAVVRLYSGRTTIRTELALIAPVLGVMLWHFGFVDRAYPSEGLELYTWWWNTAGDKLFGLQAEFLRFGTRFAKVLMLLFAVVLGWRLWRDLQWRTLLKPQVVEMLALAVTFLCIYFVLPSRYDQAAYIDVRALALISLFIVLARVHLAEGATQPAFGGPVVLLLAAVLAMLNLGYLAIDLTRDDAWMSSYRELVARIPRSATVTSAALQFLHRDGSCGTDAVSLQRGCGGALFAILPLQEQALCAGRALVQRHRSRSSRLEHSRVQLRLSFGWETLRPEAYLRAQLNGGGEWQRCVVKGGRRWH
jgi:hypothetical protein